MTITVSGNSRSEIFDQLDGLRRLPALSIEWRAGKDYGRIPECGSVITCYGKVPLEFKDARSALIFLAKTLKTHDAEVKKIVKDEAKKAKCKK